MSISSDFFFFVGLAKYKNNIRNLCCSNNNPNIKSSTQSGAKLEILFAIQILVLVDYLD